jgi:NodT family efflux transporter outer membrane factor (OMF) lipoprotein
MSRRRSFNQKVARVAGIGIRSFVLAAGAALLMAGCAVGPNFARPSPPSIRVYDTPESTPAEAATPGLAEREAAATDVPGQWWELFKSPSLDEVLRLAIANSPTLDSARNTLAAAREAIIVARAGYLPQIGATAGARRSGGSVPGTPSTSPSIYSLGLTASYSFNALGGATRRLVEEEQGLAEMERYELAAAYLTLTGGVITQAVTIASSRLQIGTTLDVLASDQKNLDLTMRMFQVGTAARTDVLTAESQLASDQTSLPSLRQQLSVARHALAILVGKAPGEWSAPDFDIKNFPVPTDIPVTLPSVLVRQRPDILASEAQLHADSAAIGVALAQEFPSITLSGTLTRESLAAAGLFHDFDKLWSVGGALAQPIFQGGSLLAQTRAARDTFAAQAASYRGVVLQAFDQVADNLRALEHDADRVTAFHRALRIASDSLALQRKSYAAGKTTVLQLIDAERSYSQAVLGNAAAEAEQLEDTVSLFVALGGGWWNTSIAPPG